MKEKEKPNGEEVLAAQSIRSDLLTPEGDSVTVQLTGVHFVDIDNLTPEQAEALQKEFSSFLKNVSKDIQLKTLEQLNPKSA